MSLFELPLHPVLRDLPEYQIESELHQGQTSIVYRARRITDNVPVVLKALRSEFPSQYDVARYRREYEIAGALRLSHVVRVIALTECQHRSVLVYEDDASVSLKKMFGGRAIHVTEFLPIAINITKALAELHANRLVHNDINPSNIVIHPSTRSCKLTDLELATAPVQAKDQESQVRARGTLAYMAPELLGRMRRSPDYRTDLYALGVTFFELLTGRPVFIGLDDAALIHAHAAIAAPDLREFVPTAPAIVESLIHKLLAKELDERYPSALSLLSDLHELVANDCAPMELATHGNASESLPKMRIVEREATLQTLAACLERVRATGDTHWLSIVGPAGIGKTSVVNAFQETLPRHEALCIGACEQGEETVPYAAFSKAMTSFVNVVLSFPESRLQKFRARLVESLGKNLGLIVQLIPRLQAILPADQRPLVRSVSGFVSNEAAGSEQARFQVATRAFLDVVCDEQEPLLLFLDDVQWADSASVVLLQSVLTSDVRHLYLITSRRPDDEAVRSVAMESKLKGQGVALSVLQVEALSRASLELWINDLFSPMNEGTASELLELVYARTLGNPRFARNLLTELEERKVVQRHDAVWSLDLTRLAEVSLPESIIKLQLRRVDEQTGESRSVIDTASCIGNAFDVETLSVITNRDTSWLQSQLARGVTLGLFDKITSSGYRFVHEQIRNHVYGKINDEARAQIHSNIAAFWLSTDRRSLFECVSQLAQAATYRNDELFLIRAMSLCAQAARVARSQTAYEPALGYARKALSIQERRDPAMLSAAQQLQLLTLLAECEASAGHLTAALTTFADARRYALSSFEVAALLERQCDALQSSGQPAVALTHVQEALAMLGQPLVLGFTGRDEEHVEYRAALLRQLSLPETLEKLSAIPNQIEGSATAAQISRLYDKAIISVYFCQPENLGYVVARSIKHVLESGLTPEGGLALGWWTMMLAMQDDFAIAAQFAQLAVATYSTFRNSYYGGGAIMLVHAMSLCWTTSYQDNAAGSKLAEKLLHESGNLQFASYALITQHIADIAAGVSCEAMLQSCERWQKYCARYVPLELGQAQIRSHCLRRLMRTPQDDIDYEAILLPYAEANNATDICESLNEMARTELMLGNFEQALSYAERAMPMFQAGAAGTLLLNFVQQYVLAIASARVAPLRRGAERERLELQARECTVRIEKICDVNREKFFSYAALTRAELSKLDGDYEQASMLYLRSVEHSQKNGMILLQAQATEYLAELLRQQGFGFTSGILLDAQWLYRKAGCLAKAPDTHAAGTNELLAGLRTRSSSDPLGDIDIQSALKASDALATEINLDRLLERLLAVVIENLGAQHGVLILREKEAAIVEYDSRIGLVREQLDHCDRVPISMIHYALRTGQSSVLGDGSRRTATREDPYFSRQRVRSVLAAPIMRQGNVLGVVYLENNAVANVFTHERLEVLNVVLSSAAIAIENAKLYRAQALYLEELEQRVRARTLELENANHALSRLAEVDGLTQVSNRRMFDQKCAEFSAKGEAVTILLCDVDDFKRYNDHYGHPAGDEVLRSVGRELLSLKIPLHSVVARYGGEEFAIVLPPLSTSDAVTLAEKVRGAIFALSIPHQLAQASSVVTLSIGIATGQEGETIASVLKRADLALYKAKHDGRNRATYSAP